MSSRRDLPTVVIPAPAPAVSELRCARCGRLIARLLANGDYEVRRRKIWLVLVKCGTITCVCGSAVDVGQCRVPRPLDTVPKQR